MNWYKFWISRRYYISAYFSIMEKEKEGMIDDKEDVAKSKSSDNDMESIHSNIEKSKSDLSQSWFLFWKLMKLHSS